MTLLRTVIKLLSFNDMSVWIVAFSSFSVAGLSSVSSQIRSIFQFLLVRAPNCWPGTTLLQGGSDTFCPLAARPGGGGTAFQSLSGTWSARDPVETPRINHEPSGAAAEG